MRLPHIIATFLVLMAANYSVAQVALLQGRFDTSCGYLANKIYCFGGAMSTSPKVLDSLVNMLDISTYSGSTANELMNKWVTITTSSTNLNIQPRDSPQSMQMPDGETLLISGGWTAANIDLDSQTLSFNGENQSWDVYPNYSEAPYGNRQISYSSSVYVPEYGVGFYGGIEANYNVSWAYTGVNLTAYQSATLRKRYIGYTSLTFLDIRNPSNPWSTYPTQNNKPTVFSRSQVSTFDAKSNRIFFFGGIYKDSVTVVDTYYSFSDSVIFDLTTGEWDTQMLSGQGPTGRTGHSVTLLGASQRHVLIHGGESTAKRALSDFCFTLDLDTYQWTQAATDTTLARTQHSAVTVSNDTVFIVFGMDATYHTTLAVTMLNVTNPLSITLLEKYVDPNAPISSPNSTSGTTIDPKSTTNSENNTTSEAKLSTGAIIGIAVGTVAIGLIAIAFYIYKKRKNAKKQNDEYLMEVNWDEIEKRYDEDPPHLVGNFSDADDTTTVANSIPVPNSPGAMLIQKELKTQCSTLIDKDSPSQRPDVEDGSAQCPDAILEQIRLQKPNGA